MLFKLFLLLIVFRASAAQDFAALIGPFIGQATQGATGGGGGDFGKFFSAFQGIFNQKPQPPPPTQPPAPTSKVQSPPAGAIPVPDSSDYN